MAFIVIPLLILNLVILLALLYYIIYYNFLQPGAVFYPTPTNRVKQMLRFAKANPKDTIIDLGSGDGRIIITAASQGIKAIGYENNPFLVRQSRQQIKDKNLSHLAQIKLQSFWQADFNSATIITLYLLPCYMNRLQKILEKKLTRPIKLISHDYQFPNKKYTQKKGNLYLYHFP
jgi:hypothetical protein